MTGFYLFISSDDSNSIHQNNKYHDFIVELGRQYDLNEASYLRSRNRWSVALVEIKLEDLAGFESPALPGEVLILCDLVSTSYIKNTERRVLRLLGLTGSGQLASTYQPYYIALNRTTFSNLKIQLVDKDLHPLTGSLVNQPWKLSCTLHFQKI